MTTFDGLSDAMTFYWSLTPTTLRAKVTSAAGGWVSLGFSDNGGWMVGSEAVLGTPADSVVQKVDLTELDSSGVKPMAMQTLAGAAVSTSGGVTSLTFEKLLVEDGEIEIKATGANTIIAAYGSSASLSYHTDRISASVDLATCDVAALKLGKFDEFNIVAHATLMIGAWAWLVPIGICTAIFKRWLGPKWLFLHRPIQVMALFTAFCAVMIIVLTIEITDGKDHMNEYETDNFGVHTTMGMVTLWMGAAQAIGGLIRPHNPGKGEEKSALRWAFEVLHKGGGYATLSFAVVAILSGIDHSYTFSYISNRTPFLVAAIIPTAFFALAFVGGKVYTLVIRPVAV
jgi:hypothetical protein